MANESADQLLELSQKVEDQLDSERKASRLNKKQNDEFVSSLSLLKNEIELDGRRLIIKESVTRQEAGVFKEKQKEAEVKKKELEDRRNLGMAKEGLLHEENWIHKDKQLTKGALELRQRLYISKDKALKASTNLFISHTRLQLRNLPRKSFYEKELKELGRAVAEEWSKTLSPEDKSSFYTKKKLVSHVKVMRDEQK